VLYVGRAVGKEGIRGRLLQHLQEDYWPNVSHFGYCLCNTTKEAEEHEANEIKRLQPKHNKQGK
jgi:excinuclease UvrABC nuclease subunit